MNRCQQTSGQVAEMSSELNPEQRVVPATMLHRRNPIQQPAISVLPPIFTEALWVMSEQEAAIR